MSKSLTRYTGSERVNHWVVAISFVLAALSGLAFFHPAFFFLTNLFGGGPWTRVLHPFIGLVMAGAFVWMAVRFAHHNRMEASDKQWLRQWRDVLNHKEEKLPPVGRYNGGQKLLYWFMVASMIILFVTGLLFWQPWFAPNQPIWVKGTLRGMLYGTVSEKWAAKHHPVWHKEMTGK